MNKNELYAASEKKIIDAYEAFGSIRKTSSETGYSWNKVVKTLSSHGYILSETHAEILNKYHAGMSVEKIATQLELNRKTVQAYIPRKRPLYNEEQSPNALRIKKCRENKLNNSGDE